LFFDIGEIVDHHCLGVIIRFADICGIVEPHCLNLLFIISIYIYIYIYILVHWCQQCASYIVAVSNVSAIS
jgi:hypothetical protein